jgi:hypothetical protein
MIVTSPGIYDEIPEDIYHRDTALAPELGRSLSASGAKVLLRNPARFAYEREHPAPPRDVFDLGSAAHSVILGDGPEIVAVEHTTWQTKAAKDEREQCRTTGRIPLLRKDFDAVGRMADAVKSHPLAGAILTDGKPEQSVYWIDEPTGVTCRARVDWLRAGHIVDLKTAADGSPDGFGKAAGNFAYHLSAAHYRAGIHAVTGEWLPFVLVVVEKDAPHFVSVHQFDDEFLDIGAARMRQAIELFAECESSGVWPAYGDDINTLTPPRWLH